MVRDRVFNSTCPAKGEGKLKKVRALALFAFLSLASCGVVEVKDSTPLSFDEHMRLGSIYESQGKYELALREYESAQAIDTKEAKAYFALGNVYLRTGEYGKAEKSYTRAIELGPRPEYYNNLAWALMEKGDLAAARASAEEALKSSPAKEKFIYLDTLGVLDMRAGEYGAAEEKFLQAAGTVPEGRADALSEIYRHLRELYKASGEPEKASAIDQKLEIFRGGEKEGL